MLPAAASGLLLVSALAQAESDGLSTDSFRGSDGKPVGVQVMSAVSSEMRLRVLYAAGVVGKRDTPTSIQALSTTPTLARPRSKPRSLFSAGFSSYRTDVPVGLLVSDGKLQSPVDVSPPRTQAQTGCAAATESRYRFSGILCVPPDADGWQIVPTGQYQPGQCKEAVQSGPLLIEPGGKPGVCAESNKALETAYARLVACIDGDGSLHMVLSQPTTLYPFSQWLLHGRLKCTVALNLSGAEQAGWARLATWKNPMPKFFGGVQAPLASALLIEQR